MKLLRKNKDNKSARLFLKSKYNEFQNIKLINSSNIKTKSNKYNNFISKNTDESTFPIKLTEDNPNKRKINSTNTSVKYLSNKNYKNIFHIDNLNKNDISKINRTNILNKTNNNLRIKIFSNFNEINDEKDINNIEDMKDNNLSQDYNNISSIKLSKKLPSKPINIEYNKAFPKKRFRIRYNLLLDNILKEKEKQFDKNWKVSSDKNILRKFIEKNSFSQGRKIKKAILNEYIRNITVSIEKKQNIPKPYKYYLIQTKTIYNDLNKTYSYLNNDIKYDIIHDKEKHCKSEEKIKRLLQKKYDEIDKLIDSLKSNNIPLVDNFIKNKINKNQVTMNIIAWNIDELKNLNEDIAYKHRKFFANKYGMDQKKGLINIDTKNDEFLIKYQKNLIS